MSPRVRQVLYVLFLAGFLISAPLVILYTAGFRINIETGRISQTGLLSLGTVPKGASIYVDGKKQGQKTPAVLKNILPGDHHIRMEREGFSSWEKTLSVNSRSTTFATDVALFLTKDPVLVTSGDIVAGAIQPGTGFAAYGVATGEWVEIWAITENGTQTLIARLPSAGSQDLQLAWSDTSEIVNITTNESFQRIQITNGTAIAVAPEDNLAFDDLRLEPSGDRTAVTRHRTNGTSEIVAYLPIGDYRFRAAAPGLAMLEDTERKRIVVIDPSGRDQPILLNTDAQFWQWSSDQKRLLYSDGFDLQIYDAEHNTNQTITRVSTELTGLAWYPPAAAVLYSQQNGVYAIELDDRDTRNVTTLATGENMRGLAVDARGQEAKFLGNIGGVEGVWSKQLQR